MSRLEKIELGKFSSIPIEFFKPETKLTLQDYLSKAIEAFYDEDFEAAIFFYAKVLEINKHSIEAWFGQIRSLIELKELGAAKKRFKTAKYVLGELPELMSLQALLECYGGKVKEAIRLSDASIERTEKATFPWFIRGLIYLMKGVKKKPEYWFTQAITTDPVNMYLKVDIGRACYKYGQPALTVQFLYQTTTMGARCFSYYYYLFKAAMKLKKYDRAKESFERLKIYASEDERKTKLLDVIRNSREFKKYIATS